jgi:hypothetical protein
MPGSLRIAWDGKELKDPHILEITLVSRGRRDIAKEDFDQPLEFRVGAKILAILRSASGPQSSTFRAVSFEDDLLKVGPGLIRRHQSIKLILLALGPEPVLTTSAAAVRDVDVQVLPTEQSGRRRSTKVKVAAGLAVTAVTTGLILIGLLIGRGPSTPSAPVASPTDTGADSQAASSLRAAEVDLTSASQAALLRGLTTLQEVMKTAPGDQATALKVLASFIRANSPARNNDQQVASDVQTALNVLRNRNPAHDGGAIINLNSANLTNADLSGIDLSKASLVNTDFTTANLSNANLRDANLNFAFVGGADIDGTNFSRANLSGASFYQTTMCHKATPAMPRRGYNCSASG